MVFLITSDCGGRGTGCVELLGTPHPTRPCTRQPGQRTHRLEHRQRPRSLHPVLRLVFHAWIATDVAAVRVPCARDCVVSRRS